MSEQSSLSYITIRSVVTLILMIFLLSGSWLNISQQTNGQYSSFSESGQILINVTQIEKSFISNDDFDYHYFGNVISWAGDVNGDGLNDFLVGDDYNPTMHSAGCTYLIFGRRGGIDFENDIIEPDVTIEGPHSNSRSGASATGVGDVNGDGIGDIAIGAPNANFNSQNAGGGVYVILGKRNGWTQTMSLNDADKVFYGERMGSYHGKYIQPVGDVNGDNYDDFVTFAVYSTVIASKYYLILGNESGWEGIHSITTGAASYYIGDCTSMIKINTNGFGDVNGDGLDDIVISNQIHDSSRGRVDIIFGKETGWRPNCTLENTDVTFYGEETQISTGSAVAIGDINDDDIVDILIGAAYGSLNGTPRGYVKVIHGKSSGWEREFYLDNSIITFYGEKEDDGFGYSVTIPGDLNGDGISEFVVGAPQSLTGPGKVYIFNGVREIPKPSPNLTRSASTIYVGSGEGDGTGMYLASLGDYDLDGDQDMIFSAPYRDEEISYSGRVFIISSNLNSFPLSAEEILIYYDKEMEEEIEVIDKQENCYVVLTGLDSNEDSIDNCYVKVLISNYSLYPQYLLLRETGPSSGVFSNSFLISPDYPYLSKAEFSYLSNDGINNELRIDTPVRLQSIDPLHITNEKEEFEIRLENIGYSSDHSWDFWTDSDWIEFDEPGSEISGIPKNGDVGIWNIQVYLTHSSGKFDSVKTEIRVRNVAPVINNSIETMLTVDQDSNLYYDFTNDEEGQHGVKWNFWSNGTWLEFDQEGGILSGTPSNADIGIYGVKVSAYDGEFIDENEFLVSVLDVNDPPMIIPVERIDAIQDEYFIHEFFVKDIDKKDTHTWSVQSDLTFLTMESVSGKLKGSPGPEDVGSHDVKVIVSDNRGSSSYIDFELFVLNINDPPIFINISDETYVIEDGSWAFIDIETLDHDDDNLDFRIASSPDSNISISDEGLISFYSTLAWFNEPPFVLTVDIEICDGEYYALEQILIRVDPTSRCISKLISPLDGQRIGSNGTKLKWSYSESETKPVFYTLYLSEFKPDVENRRESALIFEKEDMEEYLLIDIQSGKIYYWSVVPFDGILNGECEVPSNSFIVNNPPQFSESIIPYAYPGEPYEFLISVDDEDMNDGSRLRYHLVQYPDGMSIENSTGRITWVPMSIDHEQVKIVVSVTDGFDIVKESYVIILRDNSGGMEKNGGKDLLLPLVFGGVMFLIILGSLLALFIFKKKRDSESEGKIQEIDWGDEKEPEREEIDNISSVATTLDQAYSPVKDQAKTSYQDLYGSSPPQQEEGMSKSELKEFITEKINELENVDERSIIRPDVSNEH